MKSSGGFIQKFFSLFVIASLISFFSIPISFAQEAERALNEAAFDSILMGQSDRAVTDSLLTDIASGKKQDVDSAVRAAVIARGVADFVEVLQAPGGDLKAQPQDMKKFIDQSLRESLETQGIKVSEEHLKSLSERAQTNAEVTQEVSQATVEAKMTATTEENAVATAPSTADTREVQKEIQKDQIEDKTIDDKIAADQALASALTFTEALDQNYNAAFADDGTFHAFTITQLKDNSGNTYDDAVLHAKYFSNTGAGGGGHDAAHVHAVYGFDDKNDNDIPGGSVNTGDYDAANAAESNHHSCTTC